MARPVDPERHAERRKRVLHAALACFGKKGFHGASTAELARAAGMSAGNLFHYFPSKDAIILAIAEEDRRETAQMFASVGQTENAVVAITRIAELSIAQFADPAYVRIALEIAAEAMRNPSVAAMFAKNDAASREALEQLLRRGVAQEQVDPALDIGSAALWLIALIEGAVGRIAMDRSVDTDRERDTLRTLICRFLAPRPSMPEHACHVVG